MLLTKLTSYVLEAKRGRVNNKGNGETPALIEKSDESIPAWHRGMTHARSI
jgi:hypothetical protein